MTSDSAMTILVTGGAGFVGSHIVLALLTAGYRVVVVDNLSTGLRYLVPTQAKLVEIDLRQREELARLMEQEQVTSVIHCAALTVVPESVHDPLKYYENNLIGTLALLQAMQQAGVRRMVFSSTAAVYRPTGEAPIAEDAPLDPPSPYGASKLMAERMIRDLGATGALDYTILRYFNVAGADPLGRAGQSTPSATHLIKVACETACGLRPVLHIFGTDWPTPDGTCVRDYVHVADLAKAHLYVLDALEGAARGATFNCGYGRGYSVREVILALERATGCRLPVRAAPARPGDLAQVIADGRSLRDTLGWRPEYADLDQIIAHSLAWERGLQGQQTIQEQ